MSPEVLMTATLTAGTVPDTVSPAIRSRMMAGIRGKDTKPEMAVRRYLHRLGFRYRLHRADLPGRPDIVLGRYRAVVFVHGCFWHQHPGCRFAYQPKSRQDFWRPKLRGNADRDVENGRRLETLGWRVLTVWECETSDSQLEGLAAAIRQDQGGTNMPSEAH